MNQFLAVLAVMIIIAFLFAAVFSPDTPAEKSGIVFSGTIGD